MSSGSWGMAQDTREVSETTDSADLYLCLVFLHSHAYDMVYKVSTVKDQPQEIISTEKQ